MKQYLTFRKDLTLGLALLSLALHGFVWQAKAAGPILLQDNNSSALVDPSSQAGMFHWDIQGQNQLNQQWFWYRVGNTAEASIDSLGVPVINHPDASHLDTTYFGTGFNIKVSYVLVGGAFVSVGQVGEADIAEIITVNNTSGNPLDFHLFQYSNFDLGNAGNDTVSLSLNSHALFNEADQNDNGAALLESVTGVTPGANHGEAALINSTLAKLNNAAPDTLNDNIGPVGPNDVTWALEWDLTVGIGGSKIISKDKHLSVQIVPEPSSLVLLPLGLAAFGFYRRRSRK